MNETIIAGLALAVSTLTALSQLGHGWLNAQMRADLAETREQILAAIDENFVRKTVCDLEMQACRERCERLREQLAAFESEQ